MTIINRLFRKFNQTEMALKMVFFGEKIKFRKKKKKNLEKSEKNVKCTSKVNFERVTVAFIQSSISISKLCSHAIDLRRSSALHRKTFSENWTEFSAK